MIFLADFAAQLLYAALENHAMAPFTNDSDGPVRVLAMDPTSGIIFGALVGPGETCRINRSYRAKIEPIDRVRLQPLCCISSSWVTM